MIIQLNQHYSGLLAGRAKYSPGQYDTAKGDMPHALALYLLNTEQAVAVPEAFSQEITALATLAAAQGVVDANKDMPASPGEAKSKQRKPKGAG